MSAQLSTAEHVHPSGPAEEFTGHGPWRLGVLSNPLSGGNRRQGLGAIRRCLQHYPEIPHREVRTATDVQAALEDFAGRGLILIAVNSGDGTVQAVLTVLLGQRLFPSLPLLGLLSGGTTNMTHQDLGLCGSPADALRRLLSWAHHGDGPAVILQRTILKVQTPSGTHPLYGLFFGSACIFNGIQFFHSWVHRMGLSGDPAHLLILARFLWALVAFLALPGKTAATDTSIEVTGSPSLKVDQEKIELGNVKLGQYVSASFELANTGDQALRFLEDPYIEVAAGCWPPTPTIGSMVLKPGETTTLPMKFMMHGDMGGLHEFRLHLRSNDLQQPERILTVLSNWVPWDEPGAALPGDGRLVRTGCRLVHR